MVLNFGKPGSRFLEKVVFARLGAKRPEVLVGPRFGVDNAVLRIGERRVLVVTTDPVSFIPELGPATSAWLSVNLLASDLTTSGFVPQYGIFDFNLPPEMEPRTFADYWDAFHGECARLGISIVAGHTGRYPGCNYTVIGGGVLCSVGDERQYLLSTMAENDDDIILTKGAAVETTAVLTRVFPKTVRKALGAELFGRAKRYLRKVTTVKDALAAAAAGVHQRGVTAMHDATEGGIIAAVLELANASQLGVELRLDDIPVSEETEALCKLFRIDPMTSLSEGSLIVTCGSKRTSGVLRALRRNGVPACVIGRLTGKGRGAYGISAGRRFRLKYPRADPYWKAYWKAMVKGWN